MSASWLFALLVQHAPPGNTAFSVEVVNNCNSVNVCEGARWSEFYSAWIRKETPETGAERYSSIAGALVETARELLCRNPDNSIMSACVPTEGALENKKRPRWDVLTLSVAGAAVAMLESGFREDVQVGRGSAKRPSTDGGRGRGPGGEGCLVQAHPLSAWRFADSDPELKDRASTGDRAAREAIVESLLGTDPEALKRCWRTGLRMLVHARAYCAWASPTTEWDFSMFALYGTGTSCTSVNDGKTTLRTRLFRQLLAEARQNAKEKKKKETKKS